MPPALHPRSSYTTSLFGLTLAISFLVVGVPHILPCPVDPRQYADARGPDGRLVRRRRAGAAAASPGAEGASAADDAALEGRAQRECPVPKPSGVIGRVLGFAGRDEGRVVRIVDGKRREG